ncbi:unnamed protein product [Rhizophagus irregularis]|nr:unnamed protein product [Rhizophagus irregularis]
MNPLEWFGLHCSVCGKGKTNFNWCRTCNAEHFRQNFKNWTSGNKDIDKFIQDAQLLAGEDFEVLEWIPYEKFYDVKFIAKGGFGEVYKAKWTDGLIKKWDDKKRDWERLRANDFVALKALSDSKDVSLEFIREITFHRDLNSGSIIKLYGITQDPETKNYMMVLEYAENGDRPTAEEIKSILCTWWGEIDDNMNNPSIQSELIRQIREAEKINNDNFSNLSTSGRASDSCINSSTSPIYISSRTHPEAFYVSRPLSFKNLPEPKNSDISYKRYTTKDSMEYCRINVENNNTGRLE